MTRSTHRLMYVALLATAAACSDDTDPIAPVRGASAANVENAPTTQTIDAAALADALDRVGPALGASADAEEIRAQLRSIIVQRGNGQGIDRASVQALEAALDRLERAQPALAAELDVIRLALSPLVADRMHKPFIADRMHKPFVVTRNAKPTQGDSTALSAAVVDRMHKPFVVTRKPERTQGDSAGQSPSAIDRMHKPF